MNILRRVNLLGIVACMPCLTQGFTSSTGGSTPTMARRVSFLPALSMVQNRGLEVRREGATPTEGGMTLYVKAGADGTSVGDCPFAHFVRMVLEEKALEYDLKPAVQETKPAWLIEFYQGKMPALRHRKECYVESDVIAEYLDFFFPQPPLKVDDPSKMEAANQAVAGLFPSIAKYLKHTPDGNDEDVELQKGLCESLTKLETHLQSVEGPYMTGNTMTLVDCSLAPKLYHMKTGVEAFKSGAINFEADFPAVAAYMKAAFDRPSFTKTVYPADYVTWGWTQARK